MAYILAATRNTGLTRVNHPGKKYETQLNWKKKIRKLIEKTTRESMAHFSSTR
jgi:hypothetical protein